MQYETFDFTGHENELFGLVIETSSSDISFFEDHMRASITSVKEFSDTEEIEDCIDTSDIENYYHFSPILMEYEIGIGVMKYASTIDGDKTRNSVVLFMNECPSRSTIEMSIQNLVDIVENEHSFLSKNNIKISKLRVVSFKRTEFIESLDDLVQLSYDVERRHISSTHYEYLQKLTSWNSKN